MAQTVMDVFAKTVHQYKTRPALRHKEGLEWKTRTWGAYYEEVFQAAAGFARLGVGNGDFVTIMGFNCPEWLIADVAAIAAGAVPAGIYTTSSPEQAQYVINHCGAKVIVVENQKILNKILCIRDQCPTLKAIVVIEQQNYGEPDVFSWGQLLTLGSEFPSEQIEARIAKQRPSDLATLVYTSGTTSNPKAVMLTHENLTWTAEQIATKELYVTVDDQLMSYLPLSHIAEQMTTIHGPMRAGACVHFAESLDRLPKNLLEVRPTILLGVPRIWEKIQEKMIEKGAQRGALGKKLVSWAKALGARAVTEPTVRQSLQFKLAHRLVFSKVKRALGLDRCRMQFTAAAPIARSTLDFFWSLNVPIYEIYGMSECCGPATMSLPHRKIKVGAVGEPISGSRVTLAEDGEILVQGPHVFKGYLHQEEATQQAIDAQGWLHTGDLGSFDNEGFLTITGRKKDLIITSGGENIAPEMLETRAKEIPGVEHAVVVGDRRKYLTMLLALNPEEIKKAGKEAGSKATTLLELASCKAYKAYVQQRIDEINENVAQVQTIKGFSVLPQYFSEETGELTPTLKVKRNFVMLKYQNEISRLYQ